MNNYQDDPTPPETPTDAAADRAVAKAEAAATRRRWLTLAEVVAIAGVVIAGLTLWNNWQGRQADQVAQQAQLASAAKTAKASEIVTLTATPKDDGARLALKDPEHTIQSVAVSFPTRLGVSAQTSTLDPAIEADWFKDALMKLLDDGPADQQGRLPMIIASDYWDGAEHITDRAIYDVIWTTHGRLLRGRELRLRGIVLERRQGVTQAALDAMWAKQAPARAS